MGLFGKIFGSINPSKEAIGEAKIAEMLDEDVYWQIINESLSSSISQAEQKEYLIKRLQKLTLSEIFGFKIRTEKLSFDSYNSALWCAGFLINEGCSDDAFEYFRNWIISRGKEVYTKAITNPDSLITEIKDDIDYYDFEDLIQIPDKAFEVKTSRNIYDYIDEAAVEKLVGRYPKINFSWNEEDPQSMQAICPRLFEKKWK